MRDTSPVPVSDLPSILRVEPANRCSRSCVMCPNKQIVRNQGAHDLHPDLLPDSLLRAAKDVVFLQNGEFTEAAFLEEMLARLRLHEVRLHVTTNGMLLTQLLLDDLWTVPLTSIAFSVDSMQEDVFASIRRGCNLATVLAAMERVFETKRKTHCFFPIVQVNVTIMRRNIETLPDTILTLARLGVNVIRVDYARVHQASSEAGVMESSDSLFFHQALSDRVLERCRRLLGGLPCELHLPNVFLQGQRRTEGVPGPVLTSRCRQPWTDAVIWANGNITPCTGAQNVIWGNLHEASFESIWRSAAANNFRSRVQSARPPQECLDCICAGPALGETQKERWHVL